MDSSTARNGSLRWAEDRVFNAAWAYDLAFSWDLSRELDCLLSLAGRPPRPATRVLMPACGTGRYALALAQRGYMVDASDINPEMLAIALRRRTHSHVTYTQADMTRPLGRAHSDCAAAFSLCNSFRYILDDDEIAGHLHAVHARLRPGGVYLIELALNSDPRLIGHANRWEVCYANCRVLASWTLLALTPPTSMELAEIRVEAPDGLVHEVRDEQPQRLWTPDRLLEAAGGAGFEPGGFYHLDGRPAADPTEPARYYVALRKPGAERKI